MLDLDNLEKKLDEALHKETSESLYEWFSKRRKQSYLSYLGEGHIENLQSKSSTQVKTSSIATRVNSDNEVPVNYPSFKSAA